MVAVRWRPARHHQQRRGRAGTRRPEPRRRQPLAAARSLRRGGWHRDTGGGSVTPTTVVGTATPRSGLIIVPNTGSGGVGGPADRSASFIILALVALGLSAIGSAIAMRRRLAFAGSGSRVGATGDDRLDA